MLRAFVLLGDVISSRAESSRRDLQHRLLVGCRRANQLFPEAVRAEFKVLKGADEVGGVLLRAAPVEGVREIFREALEPAHIRFVFTRGVIDVAESGRDITLMDGPAFHRAADLLGELRQSGDAFACDTGDRRFDLALTNQALALDLLRAAWSPRQHEIARLHQTALTQEEIAERLEITQQAVSYHFREGRLKQVEEIGGRLREWLQLEEPR